MVDKVFDTVMKFKAWLDIAREDGYIDAVEIANIVAECLAVWGIELKVKVPGDDGE